MTLRIMTLIVMTLSITTPSVTTLGITANLTKIFKIIIFSTFKHANLIFQKHEIYGATTVSITTLRITTLSLMTLRITTVSITTNKTQHSA
jgi:hypothetical protein